MIKLIIVFIIGLFCGVFLNALCFASKTSEEMINKIKENSKNLNEVNK